MVGLGLASTLGLPLAAFFVDSTPGTGVGECMALIVAVGPSADRQDATRINPVIKKRKTMNLFLTMCFSLVSKCWAPNCLLVAWILESSVERNAIYGHGEGAINYGVDEQEEE